MAADIAKPVSKECAHSQYGEMLCAAPQSTGANGQRPVELVGAAPAQSMAKIVVMPQISLGNNQLVQKPSQDEVILMPKSGDSP